jgi:hypothetical protein
MHPIDTPANGLPLQRIVWSPRVARTQPHDDLCHEWVSSDRPSYSTPEATADEFLQYGATVCPYVWTYGGSRGMGTVAPCRIRPSGALKVKSSKYNSSHKQCT